MSSEEIRNNIIHFNGEIKSFNNYFGGIHLWGKKHINNCLVSHNGNLDTLFGNNSIDKQLFLESMYDTFNDSIIRYMVLEVNSNINDLYDIINDLIKYKFEFV